MTLTETGRTPEMRDSIYRKTLLENGIRVVSERMPSVRSVSIGVWVMVGSRDESPENNGISHFIEHMVFKGTTKRKTHEIAESLESLGGQLNAFTSRELTCYYAHILDEHLPIAVDVLADLVLNPLFDPKEIEKEKAIVSEEISNLEETPEEVIHELFMKGLFPNHPLGFSTLGTRESVERLQREDLFQYMRTHYTGTRMVVAAAGNLDHARLVELVEKYFAEVQPWGTRKVQAPNAMLSDQRITENGSLQAHLCLGTTTYPYASEKKYGLLLLNMLLGGGMSSRLFQNIREKHGLAYSVYSFTEFLLDTGLLGIYVGTDPDKVTKCIELIQSELARLQKEPVGSDELDRAKSQLKGSLVLALENTSSRMNRLAKTEIYLEEYYSLDRILTDIGQVTPGEVNHIANELFGDHRVHVSVLRPAKSSKPNSPREES